MSFLKVLSNHLHSFIHSCIHCFSPLILCFPTLVRPAVSASIRGPLVQCGGTPRSAGRVWTECYWGGTAHSTATGAANPALRCAWQVEVERDRMTEKRMRKRRQGQDVHTISMDKTHVFQAENIVNKWFMADGSCGMYWMCCLLYVLNSLNMVSRKALIWSRLCRLL